MVNVSFGYEYEFYYVDRHDYVIARYQATPRPVSHIRGWGYQNDPTAGSELRTPVYTSVVRASRNIDRQFKWWLRNNQGYAPYFFTPSDRSLGQHHHYGLPDRMLRSMEKYHIAFILSRFYPLFGGLYANPVPSHRGLTSRYCFSLSYLNGRPISTDHYSEISDSHNGTVELRLFDANIPQVALSVTSLVKPLIEKALEIYENGRRYTSDYINVELYKRERNKALKYGLRRLDLRQYLTLYNNYIGNIRLPNLDSVKEIWYMAIKYRLNPYQVYQKLLESNSIRKYDYWKTMVSNTSKYIENLEAIIQNGYPESLSNIIDDIKSNSHRVTYVSDLIEILEEVEPRRRERIRRVIERVLPRIEYPSRNYVRRLLEQENGLSNFYVNRIYEVEGLTQEQVVNRIVDLVNNQGRGLTNPIDNEYVVNAPERFYVIWIRHPITNNPVIISTIAIRIRTGEISHFVVDRRYRGLGLGRAILNWIIGIARDNNLKSVHLWVKHENIVMQNLLRRLGFKRVDDNGESYKYVLGLSR